MSNTPRQSAFFDTATVNLATWNPQDRTFDVIAVTGDPMRFPDENSLTGSVYESLSFEPGACDLSRYNNDAVYAKDHDLKNSSSTLGVVVAGSAVASPSTRMLTNKVRLTENYAPELQDVVGKVLDRTLAHVSLDYIYSEYTLLNPMPDGSPHRLITKWQPYALAPVAAGHCDKAVSLGLNVATAPRSEIGSEATPTKERKTEMTTQGVEVEKVEGAPATPVVADTKARELALEAENRSLKAEREALKAEKEKADREKLIETKCRALGLDNETESRLVGENTTKEQAILRIIDEKAKASTAQTPEQKMRSLAFGNSIGTDDKDRFTAATSVLIKRKMGFVLDKEDEKLLQGNPMLNFSTTQIAQRSLAFAGFATVPDNPRDIVLASYQAYKQRALINDTSSLPAMTENVLNKQLAKEYGEMKPSYRNWLRQINLSDFKPASFARLSGIGELHKRGYTGTAEDQKLTDHAEKWKIETYFDSIRITDEMLINDDLSSMSSLPRKWSFSAERTEQTAFVNWLLTNANMTDGNPIFSSDHKNILAASALNAATLGKMRAILGAQRGLAGEYLSLRLESILVPNALLDPTEQYLSPNYTPITGDLAVLPWMRALTVVDEPRIDGSTTPSYWFGFAPTSMLDIGVYGYLQSRPGPQIRAEIDWDTRDMKMQCELFFGLAIVDYRGIVQCPYVVNA